MFVSRLFFLRLLESLREPSLYQLRRAESSSPFHRVNSWPPTKYFEVCAVIQQREGYRSNYCKWFAAMFCRTLSYPGILSGGTLLFPKAYRQIVLGRSCEPRRFLLCIICNLCKFYNRTEDLGLCLAKKQINSFFFHQVASWDSHVELGSNSLLFSSLWTETTMPMAADAFGLEARSKI